MVQTRAFQGRPTVAYRQPTPPPSTNFQNPVATTPLVTGSLTHKELIAGRTAQREDVVAPVPWDCPTAETLSSTFEEEGAPVSDWQVTLLRDFWSSRDVESRIARADVLLSAGSDARRAEALFLAHVVATQYLSDISLASLAVPITNLLIARHVTGAPSTQAERFALVDLYGKARLVELNRLDVAGHLDTPSAALTPEDEGERKALRPLVYERLQAQSKQLGAQLSKADVLLLTGLQLELVRAKRGVSESLPPTLAERKGRYFEQIAEDRRAGGVDIPFDVIATSPAVIALYTRLHGGYRHDTNFVRAHLLQWVTSDLKGLKDLSESQSSRMRGLIDTLTRDRTWRDSDERWTARRVAQPSLSLWSHPLLSATNPRESYDLVARAIGSVVGADQAAEYVRHPMIWGALFLLGRGLPAGTLQDAALYPLMKDWKSAQDIWRVLDAVDEDDAVRAAAEVALDMGLGAFFQSVGIVLTQEEQSELKAAELMLKGARLVWNTTTRGYGLAVQHGQRLGMEDEFVAAPSLPDKIDFRPESVDTIYTRVERALRAAEFEVTTGHFDTDFFHLLPTTKWLAAEYWQFQSATQDRSVRYLLLRGTGATMVFEYQLDALGRPIKTTKYKTTHEDEKAGGVALTQARLDMQQLASTLLDVRSASIGDLMQSRDDQFEVEGVRRETGTVLMTKDKQGEIPQALVTFNANGTARVVGLNFRFNNPDGEPLDFLTLTATTAVDVQKQLGQRIHDDPSFYLMTNRKSGLRIAGIEGALRVIDEQHLINEVVTQRLTMGEMALRVVEAIVQGLSLAGYPSTSDHTAAGRHVHAEVKSPRELLAVMLDYANDEAAILAFWNPNPVRREFIQPLPDGLKRRLALKGYADVKTDSDARLRPAERKALAWQELCRWADVAVETPPKYSGANADNYIALRVRELVLGEQDKDGSWVVHPVLDDGDSTTISDFYGRVYRFTVKKRQAVDIDGKTFWDYGVTVRYEGKDYVVNRVADALVKSTLELRIYNTSSADRDDRGPVLDPAAAVLSVKFWASYVAQRRFGGAFVQ